MTRRKNNYLVPPLKDSVLQIRLPDHEKEQFLQVCKDLDTTAARELRLFIREFLKKNAQGKLL